VFGALPSLRPKAPGAARSAGAALALSLVAVLAYWSHLRHGGLWSDDWSNLADYSFASSPRYLGAVARFHDYLGARPLLSVVLPLPPALFGADGVGQASFGLGLAVLASLTLFLALSTLGMDDLSALAVAALSLLLPLSDATRLWPTAAVNNAALVFFFLGVAMSVLAVHHRAPWAHAVGLALLVLSVATYEVAGVAAMVLGPLYALYGERAAARRRWAADIVVIGAAMMCSALVSKGVRDVTTAGGFAKGIGRFGLETPGALADTLLPRGALAWSLAALALLLAAAALGRRRSAAAASSASWRWWMLGGLCLFLAAWVPVAGSGLRLSSVGLDNRGNLLIGPALVLTTYSGLMWIGATLRLRSEATRAPLLALALVCMLAANCFVGLKDHMRSYAAASEGQRDVLGAFARLPPRLMRGKMIYAFGFRGAAAPRVPVFSESWDLKGALQLLYRDRTLRAQPVVAGVSLRCDRDTIRTFGQGIELPESTGRLRRSVAVDVGSGRVVRIRDRRTCEGVRRAVSLRSLAGARALVPRASSRTAPRRGASAPAIKRLDVPGVAARSRGPAARVVGP
jgi:hypothetical protein